MFLHLRIIPGRLLSKVDLATAAGPRKSTSGSWRLSNSTGRTGAMCKSTSVRGPRPKRGAMPRNFSRSSTNARCPSTNSCALWTSTIWRTTTSWTMTRTTRSQLAQGKERHKNQQKTWEFQKDWSRRNLFNYPWNLKLKKKRTIRMMMKFLKMKIKPMKLNKPQNQIRSKNNHKINPITLITSRSNQILVSITKKQIYKPMNPLWNHCPKKNQVPLLRNNRSKFRVLLHRLKSVFSKDPSSVYQQITGTATTVTLCRCSSRQRSNQLKLSIPQ